MFLKLFWILFMCITSHKNHFQVVLLHKIPVFKVLKFLTTLTDQTCKFLCSKLFASVDRCLIDVQLIVNGKFSVFRFLADQSFHALFVFGFTCIALFSLSILHFAIIFLIDWFHTQHTYTLLNWVLNLI